MSGFGAYDCALFLRQSVVADAFLRLLADPTSALGALPPRRLVDPPGVDEPHIQIWWDKPVVSGFTEAHTAELSVDLAGGARQLSPANLPGRIASIQGTVKAGATASLTVRDGTPHVVLGVGKLDMRDLRAGYAGSSPYPLVGLAEGGNALDAVARALGADLVGSGELAALAQGLLEGLSRAPLSYATDVMAGVPSVSDATITVFTATSEPTLAIGIRGAVNGASENAPDGVSTAALQDLLERHTQSNVAVALTSAWLTDRLRGLLDAGAIARSIPDPDGRELGTVESLAVSIGPGEVTCSGSATREGQKARIAAKLNLGLDADDGGWLTLAPPEEAVSGDDVIHPQLAYWRQLIATLFGARYHDGTVELIQRLRLPDSSVAFDVPVDTIESDSDMLVLYCSVPTDAEFKPDKPEREPQATLAQPDIPTQSAAGLPVMALANATLSAPSYPPYDYAWLSDFRLFTVLLGLVPAPLASLVRSKVLSRLPAHVAQNHTSTTTVVGVPHGIYGETVTLSHAKVAIIDGFGQVAQAERDVLAHPAKPWPHPARIALAGVSAAVALSLFSVAIARGMGGASSGTTTAPPGVGFVAPQMPLQVCAPNSMVLPPTAITLDNTKGLTAVSWQAIIQQPAPGSTMPWATFADGQEAIQGILPAGRLAMEAVLPESHLCGRILGHRDQRQFAVVITYANGRQVSVSETVDLVFTQVFLGGQTSDSISPEGNLALAQYCDARFNTPVQPFTVVVDNRASTLDVTYRVGITDTIPIGVGQGAPTTAPAWATADSPVRSLPAGQIAEVTITPSSQMCQSLFGEGSQYFHVNVSIANWFGVVVSDLITPQIASTLF